MHTPKFSVFIGRFQPIHIGHVEVITRAAQISDYVIILVGSSYKPRSPKNPWSFTERHDMIFAAIPENLHSRVLVFPIRDFLYSDEQWANNVQQTVMSFVAQLYTGDCPDITLIGHTKDESSYYLKMFPQWKRVEYELNETVNATDIRGLLFDNKSLRYIQAVVPAAALRLMVAWKSSPSFKAVMDEYNILAEYKKSWALAPYPPTFVTTDAIVVQSGHILLIRRKHQPGQGLFALPGGFVGVKEPLIDSMIRELREETRIKVPAPVLRGSVSDVKVFDAPDRSLRGRTITHAFLIKLPSGPLVDVKGSDDAMDAMWVPISNVKSDTLFEDHDSIIEIMTGVTIGGNP